MTTIVVTNSVNYGKYRVQNIANNHLGKYFYFNTLDDAMEYANDVIVKANTFLAIDDVYQY